MDEEDRFRNGSTKTYYVCIYMLHICNWGWQTRRICFSNKKITENAGKRFVKHGAINGVIMSSWCDKHDCTNETLSHHFALFPAFSVY